MQLHTYMMDRRFRVSRKGKLGGWGRADLKMPSSTIEKFAGGTKTTSLSSSSLSKIKPICVFLFFLQAKNKNPTSLLFDPKTIYNQTEDLPLKRKRKRKIRNKDRRSPLFRKKGIGKVFNRWRYVIKRGRFCSWDSESNSKIIFSFSVQRGKGRSPRRDFRYRGGSSNVGPILGMFFASLVILTRVNLSFSLKFFFYFSFCSWFLVK